MNCNSFETLIALYVENDLQDTECMRVEAHLEACPACANLAQELRETQSAFKSLRAEMPSVGALSGVRERVFVEVEACGRRLGWLGLIWRKAALAGIAIIALAVGAVYDRPSLNQPAPVPVAVNPPPPVPPVAPQPSPRPPTRAVRRTPTPRRPAGNGEATSQLVVKLITDDPNVIIYWLIDKQGE